MMGFIEFRDFKNFTKVASSIFRDDSLKDKNINNNNYQINIYLLNSNKTKTTQSITILCLISKVLVSGGRVGSLLALFSRYTLLCPRFPRLCCRMEFSEAGSSGW